MMAALGGVLIGLVALFVAATMIGACIIGGLKERARFEHERRHEADSRWPRVSL